MRSARRLRGIPETFRARIPFLSFRPLATRHPRSLESSNWLAVMIYEPKDIADLRTIDLRNLRLEREDIL